MKHEISSSTARLDQYGASIRSSNTYKNIEASEKKLAHFISKKWCKICFKSKHDMLYLVELTMPEIGCKNSETGTKNWLVNFWIAGMFVYNESIYQKSVLPK